MKKLFLLAAFCVFIFGCLDSSEEPTGPDPANLVGLWDVTEIREDGLSYSFSNARILCSGGSYSGFIYDYQSEDVDFDGSYSTNGDYINVNITWTTNTGLIQSGPDSYYYETDGIDLYIRYTTPLGTLIEIRAVSI